MEDKELRQEFARLFQWYDFEKEYGYSQTKKILREPTWAEIHCEIGKLLAFKEQAYLSQTVSKMEESISELYVRTNPQTGNKE